MVFFPLLANECVWRETAQGLEPAGEIVGCAEVREAAAELVVRFIVKALDGCLFDRAVHSFHLAVRPGVFHLGQTVLDTVFITNPAEDVMEGINIAGPIGELDAVIGQNRVDFVENGLDQAPKEPRCDHFTRLLMKLDKGELAGPVDGDEQAQLVLSCLNLGDIDVKVTDRIGLELGMLRLVAFGIRQAGDAVTLKEAMQ